MSSTLVRRATPTSATPNTHTVPGVSTQEDRRCCDVHCNSLWSIWYGLLVVAFEAFIIYKAVTRFLIYIALPWPDGRQPYLELNLFVGLVGAGVVLLPFYCISFLFKIGNLANDGYKLGYKLSACAMDPPSILARSNGFIRNAWHHGGPTAPFIHLVSAFCFALPKIFIEARLIEVGFRSQDHLWKTDLDWLVPQQDRLVILHFLTGGAVNASSSSSAAAAAGLATTPAPYHHPAAQIRDYLDKQDLWWPCSPEFLNYALALIVYAVRYPAVFWNTNKGFAFLFSMQLVCNGVQHLVSLCGLSVMYKVQILGPQNVLHKYEPFLLNPPICSLLYLLACCVVHVSACVVYMYGYHKFMTFVETEREKHQIVLRSGPNRTSLWAYFPHCSALCVLIALAVCQGPLLYDYTLIYKGSLDGTVLTCVVATILHLFFWIVLWLFLTLKQTWQFKLRVTVGHAVVRGARSIKLLNDVDLHNDGSSNDTMMIVAFGKSFTVAESAPKKLIMNTLARAAIERDKAMENEEEAGAVGGEADHLLPANANSGVSSARGTPALNESRANTAQRKRSAAMAQQAAASSPAGSGSMGSNNGGRQQVSFEGHDEADGTRTAITSPRMNHGVQSPSARSMSSNRAGVEEAIPVEEHQFTSNDENDLDELPPPPGIHCEAYNVGVGVGGVNNGNGLGSRQNLTSPKPGGRITNKTSSATQVAIHHPEIQEVQTPRSNRSIDSGLPHDDITPRSDSLSTASSASPPDQQHNNIHNGHQHLPQQQLQQQQQHPGLQSMREQHRKSTSMDDINIGEQRGHLGGSGGGGSAMPAATQWKSCSLQRGMAAPSSSASGGDIYGTVEKKNGDGTLVIRRGTAPAAAVVAATEEEDPYGRCLNMPLTSFSESQGPGGVGVGGGGGPNPRDPRIIDLTHSTPSSQSNSVASTPRQGSPVQQQLQQQPSQFNTLPAQVNGGPNGSGRPFPQPPASAHNTLPARMSNGNGNANGNTNGNGNLPPPSARNNYGPTGRHFKPFDHRKMNPMAEIQEHPCGMHESTYGTLNVGNSGAPENPYGTRLPHPHEVDPGMAAAEQQQQLQQQPANMIPAAPQHVQTQSQFNRPLSSVGGNLIVHKNTHLPHMPSELRHTNYSSTMGEQQQQQQQHMLQRKQQLMNPQVMDHRDSANFSLASSDSG